MEGNGALILDGDLQVNAWCLYTSLEITSAKISFLPSAFYLQLYNMIYLSFCLYVDVCGGVSVCVCVSMQCWRPPANVFGGLPFLIHCFA